MSALCGQLFRRKFSQKSLYSDSTKDKRPFDVIEHLINLEGCTWKPFVPSTGLDVNVST